VARRSPASPAVVAAFAAMYLFGSGTFLAIRYVVTEVPPLLAIGLRCLAGAAVLSGWLAWRGGAERPTRDQWLTAASAGVFLFVGCHGVLAWAEQRVSSGQAALLMTTIPISLVLLTSIRARRAPPGIVLVGLALGTLGVGLLVQGSGAWSGTTADRVALVGSGVSWSVGSIIARDGARPASAVQSTTMQLAGGGVAVLLLSLSAGELGNWHVQQVTMRGIASFAFLVVPGTAVAFGAYTWLLRFMSPAAVGSSSFVNPVLAIALAWALGDEPVSGRTIVAALTVFAAVFLIWKGSSGPSTRSTATTIRGAWNARTHLAGRDAR
jgi:drug/metabolite transporter (DMT)-like permease